MRRLWPQFVSIVLMAMLAAPALAGQEGIQWMNDLEAAKTLAKQTNRLVLVHFWKTSCGPCVMLDQTVFNQANVAGTIEGRFVPVKLNADENPATAMGFGISRVPTDVVLTPDGHVVGKTISPPTPAGYLAELTQIASAYSAAPGGAFAAAAANAPSPSALNAAYAGLQVGSTAQPIAPQSSLMQPTLTQMSGTQGPSVPVANTTPTNVQFGATPQAGGQNQSTSMPSWSNTQQNTANPFATSPQQTPDRYAANSPPSQGAASTSMPGTTPAAPVTINNPAVAPLAATFGAPPAPGVASQGAAPSSVNNPYASLPVSQNAQQPITPIGAAAPNGAAPALITGTSANALTFRTDAAQAGAPLAAATAAAAPAAGTNTDSRQLPAGAPPLGFDGYCPVSMRNNWKWIPGDPRFGVVHRGRTYWFAGQQELQQFWNDPDRFSPALSGMDPVMAIDHQQQVPGKREHSIDYDNLFYMFSSEATLSQFTANPEKYAVGVRQAMGIQRGRLVR